MANDPITWQWFYPSILRRLGWGERRIRDKLIQAPPGHWRGYPQLDMNATDWANETTKIDTVADAVEVHWFDRDRDGCERMEELALLLPVDAAGMPMVANAPPAITLPMNVPPALALAPPTSDQQTTALPSPAKIATAKKFSALRKANPRMPGEPARTYAVRLFGLLQECADQLTCQWTLETVERRLRRSRK